MPALLKHPQIVMWGFLRLPEIMSTRAALHAVVDELQAMMCVGKIKHRHIETALKQIEKDSDREFFGCEMNAYDCIFCGYAHIGRLLPESIMKKYRRYLSVDVTIDYDFGPTSEQRALRLARAYKHKAKITPLPTKGEYKG